MEGGGYGWKSSFLAGLADSLACHYEAPSAATAEAALVMDADGDDWSVGERKVAAAAPVAGGRAGAVTCSGLGGKKEGGGGGGMSERHAAILGQNYQI